MKSVCFTLVIIAVSVLSFGFTPVSDWDTKRESENVKLQYRQIKNKENQEFRQFRAVLHISASLTSFLKNMNEEKRLAQWTAKSKDCKIYDKSDSEWITYTLFDIPKPLTQRDLVLKHTVQYDHKNTIVRLTPLPNYLPRQENVSRLDEYMGYWKIIPEDGNRIRVEFYYTSTRKPVIPRFIIDPILQKMLMESFTKLIEMSEAA